MCCVLSNKNIYGNCLYWCKGKYIRDFDGATLRLKATVPDRRVWLPTPVCVIVVVRLSKALKDAHSKGPSNCPENRVCLAILQTGGAAAFPATPHHTPMTMNVICYEQVCYERGLFEWSVVNRYVLKGNHALFVIFSCVHPIFTHRIELPGCFTLLIFYFVLFLIFLTTPTPNFHRPADFICYFSSPCSVFCRFLVCLFSNCAYFHLLYTTCQ